MYLADIADDLYETVSGQIETLIRKHFGDKYEEAEPHLRKTFYPDDPQAICDIMYQGKVILQVRMRDDFMAVNFVTPKSKEIQENAGVPESA